MQYIPCPRTNRQPRPQQRCGGGTGPAGPLRAQLELGPQSARGPRLELGPRAATRPAARHWQCPPFAACQRRGPWSSAGGKDRPFNDHRSALVRGGCFVPRGQRGQRPQATCQLYRSLRWQNLNLKQHGPGPLAELATVASHPALPLSVMFPSRIGLLRSEAAYTVPPPSAIAAPSPLPKPARPPCYTSAGPNRFTSSVSRKIRACLALVAPLRAGRSLCETRSDCTKKSSRAPAQCH